MKRFLNRRRNEVVRNGVETSFDYILEEDLNNFYDINWMNEWNRAKDKIKPIEVDGKKAYYYYDYKTLAIGINYYF